MSTTLTPAQVAAARTYAYDHAATLNYPFHLTDGQAAALAVGARLHWEHLAATGPTNTGHTSDPDTIRALMRTTALDPATLGDADAHDIIVALSTAWSTLARRALTHALDGDDPTDLSWPGTTAPKPRVRLVLDLDDADECPDAPWTASLTAGDDVAEAGVGVDPSAAVADLIAANREDPAFTAALAALGTLATADR